MVVHGGGDDSGGGAGGGDKGGSHGGSCIVCEAWKTHSGNGDPASFEDGKVTHAYFYFQMESLVRKLL